MNSYKTTPVNHLQKATAMKSKKWLFLSALWILIVLPAHSQSFSESKKYVHQFALSPKTTVEISNKYGKIQLLTWKNDSVRVDIDFYISSSSPSRLAKLKQNINFDFTNTNFYVGVKTVFGKSTGNVIDEIKDFAEAIVSGSNEVRIDYIVHIPQGQAIKITNKYGDIYSDDMTGDVQISLSNGDLKANDLKGNSQIALSFGNAFINGITKGRIVAEYADVNIKSADNLSLESKSSKINIEKATLVKLSSRRDDLRIENATSVLGDSYFSNINIQNISDEVSLSSKFGKLTVDNFQKGFSFANITSEYTDVDFYFERSTTFDFDITYYKDVLLRLPKEAEKTEEKTLSADLSQQIMYGRVGNTASKAKVKIVAPKKCYINLYIK